MTPVFLVYYIILQLGRYIIQINKQKMKKSEFRRKTLSRFSRTKYGPQYRGARKGMEASSCMNTYLADIKAAGSGWGGVLRTWWGKKLKNAQQHAQSCSNRTVSGLSRNSPGTVRGALNTALKTERRVLSLGMEQRPKITRGRCWNQSELASRERKAALSDRWNCSMSPLLWGWKLVVVVWDIIGQS